MDSVWLPSRDAKALLAPVKALPQGVRPLGAIIAEFCELKEAQQRRAQLLSANAALSEINDVIERHACGEAHPAAPPMPAAPADRVTLSPLGHPRIQYHACTISTEADSAMC